MDDAIECPRCCEVALRETSRERIDGARVLVTFECTECAHFETSTITEETTMNQSDNKPALFENVERLRTILQALTVAKRAAIAEREAMPEEYRPSFEARVLAPIVAAGNDVARALMMIAVTMKAALDSMPAVSPEAPPAGTSIH